MEFEDKAHEILDMWRERFMASPIHQRLAAQFSEDMESGIETKIDELEQSAANEHADAIMLSVLGQAIDNYGIARATLQRIQARLEMLSHSVKGYPASDDMAEYVANRIHAIQIEELARAFAEASKE